MKLCLGAGDKAKPGYVTVDIRPFPSVDIVSDVRTLSLQENAYEEILAFDLIEHLSCVEAKQLLRHCYEWLGTNGILILHTTNMQFCASRLCEGDDREALRWIFGTFGEGETDYPEGYHKWSYSKHSLTDVLTAIGFQVLITDIDCKGYGLRVTAVKK